VASSLRSLAREDRDAVLELSRRALNRPAEQVGNPLWATRDELESELSDWSPPPEVKRDKPRLPNFIRGGSPSNPMGAAALTLGGGEYAIHGTNRPGSIGGFVSYGCIRMHNHDVIDLFGRVSVGTPVVVVR
jgi:lipoprotein-anchoring transpeptidase ErfK/SrfK